MKIKENWKFIKEYEDYRGGHIRFEEGELYRFVHKDGNVEVVGTCTKNNVYNLHGATSRIWNQYDIYRNFNYKNKRYGEEVEVERINF